MYSIFESEITVQPDYGCHHGDNYAKFFNLIAYVRETQLAERYGLTVEDINARGFSLHITTCHINFLRDAGEGEPIIVKTQIDNFSGGAFNVNFWIHTKSKKKIVADGYFVYTLKSSESDLPDHFPDDFVAKLSI